MDGQQMAEKSYLKTNARQFGSSERKRQIERERERS